MGFVEMREDVRVAELALEHLGSHAVACVELGVAVEPGGCLERDGVSLGCVFALEVDVAATHLRLASGLHPEGVRRGVRGEQRLHVRGELDILCGELHGQLGAPEVGGVHLPAGHRLGEPGNRELELHVRVLIEQRLVLRDLQRAVHVAVILGRRVRQQAGDVAAPHGGLRAHVHLHSSLWFLLLRVGSQQRQALDVQSLPA